MAHLDWLPDLLLGRCGGCGARTGWGRVELSEAVPEGTKSLPLGLGRRKEHAPTRKTETVRLPGAHCYPTRGGAGQSWSLGRSKAETHPLTPPTLLALPWPGEPHSSPAHRPQPYTSCKRRVFKPRSVFRDRRSWYTGRRVGRDVRNDFGEKLPSR